MRKKKLLMTCLVLFAASLQLPATVILFEKVGLPLARELDGLESVPGYADNITGVSTGGFAGSFAMGNGWTPNVTLGFAAGNDIKTVSSWRADWDGGDDANYLLDGDSGEPYYYWYTFTPSGGAGVVVNSLDLDGAGASNNKVDWRIYAASKVGKVLASGSTGSFSGDRENISLGMKGPHFGIVVLELVHTGTRTALAVDNIDFDEVAPGAGAGQVVEVGHRKQLLVDDYAIARTVNVVRSLGKVTKLNGGEPLLVRDQPWERSCWFYGTALHDGEKFQMWYRASLEPFALGYAHSRDGVNWVKPKLGLVDFSGSRQNNIVDVELGLAYAFSCFIDPHETDPKQKYKCCWGHPRKIRACLGYSADGIRWTPYNKGEPVTGRAADTHSDLVWDEDAGVYRLFTRTDYQRRIGAEMEVRGHRVMTNPDIKRDPTAWRLGRNWYFNRDPKEYRRRQVYSMTDWIYHGVHFALINLYEFPEDKSEGPLDLHKRHERDVLNFYIATSRDAENWDFHWIYAGHPLIPRGPDGSFDKDMIIPPSNIITHKDQHWIYYGGSNERHGAPKREYGIGGATLRLDGFICLEAKGDGPGTVVTKPFKLEGDRLQVNVAGQEVTVEVLNEQGHPVPGFSAKDAMKSRDVDELRLAPSWDNGNRLSMLKGNVIRLKFYLKNARLYAFHIPQ
ncbi:MAG: hypothetical protein VCA55_08080 [Verrucomicrobiales bacterium]